MTITLATIAAAAAFVFGVLWGRHNANKAKAIQGAVNEAAERLESKVSGKKV